MAGRRVGRVARRAETRTGIGRRMAIGGARVRCGECAEAIYGCGRVTTEVELELEFVPVAKAVTETSERTAAISLRCMMSLPIGVRGRPCCMDAVMQQVQQLMFYLAIRTTHVSRTGGVAVRAMYGVWCGPASGRRGGGLPLYMVGVRSSWQSPYHLFDDVSQACRNDRVPVF